jgi:hypothetical protein
LSCAIGRAVYDRGVELRSSQELLVWLAELSADTRCGALQRGEYLLMLASGEGKVAQRPKLLADWLYELRDGGMIDFDDWDFAPRSGPDGELSRRDVLLIRNIGVIAAGREFLKSAQPR